MLSDVVELAALACIDAAAWLHSPTAGLLVLGAALWLVAQALDGVKVSRPQVKWPKARIPRPAWPKAARPGARET